MTMGEAYTRLPAKARRMMLLRAALRGAAPEARDRARVRLCWMPGGREAFVGAVLKADPTWAPRRHVTCGLGRLELEAARAADAAMGRRVARARGGVA